MLSVGRSGFSATARAVANSSSRMFSSSLEQQDVVVIGGGPGGYVAAIKAAQLGLKTTCIESRGTLGGTCLNVGCIPSKALLNNSLEYERVSSGSLAKHGVKVGDVELDMEALLKQKNEAVKGLTAGVEFLLKKNKVTYVKGKGKFTSPNDISVELNDGGTQEISTKNVIIATGSEVTPLGGFEIDEVDIVSSTGALDIEKPPKRLLVIGGGVIGLELGSVWNRLGSEVQVVEFQDAIAAGADGEVAKTFQRLLKKQGMKFLMKHKCISGTKNAEGSIDVVVEPAAGGEQKTLQFDKVLVSVGRRPYTDGLGLEAAGVKVDKFGRVETNEHLQSNVPHIYGIGDVIEGPMLAHKAEDEGLVVAEAIAGQPGHINYDAIPSVVYTHPEVAWVGATEEQLKEDGIEYNVGKFPMAANSRAKTVGATDGFVKTLAEKDTDRILGVHIIHDQAGEMIAEAGIAVEYEASAEDIARATHAHPTLMEAVKESAMLATFGKAIHV